MSHNSEERVAHLQVGHIDRCEPLCRLLSKLGRAGTHGGCMLTGTALVHDHAISMNLI